jgi:hypothetical protein
MLPVVASICPNVSREILDRCVVFRKLFDRRDGMKRIFEARS